MLRLEGKPTHCHTGVSVQVQCADALHLPARSLQQAVYVYACLSSGVVMSCQAAMGILE
jgi:hypothetical protein